MQYTPWSGTRRRTESRRPIRDVGRRGGRQIEDESRGHPRAKLCAVASRCVEGGQTAGNPVILMVAGSTSYFSNTRIKRHALRHGTPPHTVASLTLPCRVKCFGEVRSSDGICRDLNVQGLDDSVWRSRPTASLSTGNHAEVRWADLTDSDISAKLRKEVLCGFILSPVPEPFDGIVRKHRLHH